MKKTKGLIVALCSVLIAVTAILGTVSYLTDTEGVVNTFTVGKVNLVLDEAAVNSNGEPTGGRTEEGNAYHLIPDKTYTKDPTVTVMAGSEEAYVRMLVTVNCYDELCSIFGDSFSLDTLVDGLDGDVWVSVGDVAVDESENTGTYEFRYSTPVAGGDEGVKLDALFTSIVMPETLTGEDLEKIADLEINVVAHAIQKSGFDTAENAWAAFDK